MWVMQGISRRDRHRRRSVALLLAMWLILLLIAGAVELVATTAVETVVQTRRQRSLAHELAVDGALLVLADRLVAGEDLPSRLVIDLDRRGWTIERFDVGGVLVACTLRDDGAKFNPNLFPAAHQDTKLTRALTTLAARRGLPTGRVAIQSMNRGGAGSADRPFRWFDQIVVGVQPGAMFRRHGTPSTSPVWSDVVSMWGDGRIDLRRVHEDVLEAALMDIRPGLARKMLAARPTDRTVNDTDLTLRAVDSDVRQRVASRLTFDAKRYAIELNTMMGSDTRRWYVVAHIDDGEVEILHRSRLTW